VRQQVNLFFNTYLIHEDKFSRLQQTDANLLCCVDYKECPLQTNGHDCGIFAVAIALHFAKQIELHRDLFLQADVTKAR
jgi:Ulp1 family protease